MTQGVSPAEEAPIRGSEAETGPAATAAARGGSPEAAAATSSGAVGAESEAGDSAAGDAQTGREAAGPAPLSLASSASPRERFGLDACFQCSRCSVGCTVAEVTDLLPHRIVRLAQLGQREQLLRAEHLWLCTGCGTCTTRCPNQVQVAELVDHLKAEAFARQAHGQAPPMVRFHALFHDAIYRYGRNHEMGLVRRLKTTREMLGDLGMGLRMVRRGKLRLRADKVRDREAVRALYARAGLVEEKK